MADYSINDIPPEFLTKEEKKTRDSGWQTVPSRSKPKKVQITDKAGGAVSGKPGSGSNSVFTSLEDEAKHRRAQIEAKKQADADAGRDDVDSDEDELEFEGYGENAKAKAAAAAAAEEEKKEKKPKKPKVTVAEAASKIDVEELSAFLLQINDTFASSPDVQLMRCADFFARAFSTVTPVVNIPKIIKDSSMQKALEAPLSEVPEPVISTVATWLQARPLEDLGKFLELLLSVATEDLLPQGKAPRGQPLAPQKAKVGMLVVLAVLLRKKPEVVLAQAESIRGNAALHTQERLPFMAWVYGQVAQTELTLGLWLWSRNLLPLGSGKQSTPISRDIILSFLENVLLKNPKKARAMLINGAVRKGERLITPAALDLYLRLSFPAPEARTKATERFTEHYQLVKDVALAGVAKGRTTRPAAAQLFPLALTAVLQESTREEACSMLVWCLAENNDCYQQWEKHYLEELDASCHLLKHLLKNWQQVRGQLEPLKDFSGFLKDLKTKNKSAEGSTNPQRVKLLASAESVRQRLEAKMSWVPACTRATATLAVVAAMGYGFYLLSPAKNPWGWDGYLLLSRTHGPFTWPTAPAARSDM